MTEQLDDAMHSSMRIKVRMAQRMATSRRQRDRVLDPANLSIHLDTFTTPSLWPQTPLAKRLKFP